MLFLQLGFSSFLIDSEAATTRPQETLNLHTPFSSSSRLTTKKQNHIKQAKQQPFKQTTVIGLFV